MKKILLAMILALSLLTFQSAFAGSTTTSVETGTEEDTTPTIMCTMQYAPVCGKSLEGSIKTYGNSCMAGADKATTLYQGECTTVVPPTLSPKPVLIDTNISTDLMVAPVLPGMPEAVAEVGFWQKVLIRIKSFFSFLK